MCTNDPNIKRRMNQEPDEETVIMKSQMQEVEERNTREAHFKSQKKLKEKMQYAREGAIEKVSRPNGGEHYRSAGKTKEEKAKIKKENKSDRIEAKRKIESYSED